MRQHYAYWIFVHILHITISFISDKLLYGCSSCCIYILSRYRTVGQTVTHFTYYCLQAFAQSHVNYTVRQYGLSWRAKFITQWSRCEEKNDSILMKQWWVCACDSPGAVTGEVWGREMIKGKLCSVENRAIIGMPAFPCCPRSPERQAVQSVMGPMCLINVLTHTVWKEAEPSWHRR